MTAWLCSALLLVSAVDVGLEVTPMRGVPPRTRAQIIEHVSNVLELNGRRVRGVTEPVANGEILRLEVVGAVTTLRITVERIVMTEGAPRSVRQARRDVPKDDWTAPLSSALKELYGPLVTTAPDPSTLTSAQAPPESLRPSQGPLLWPLAITAAGVAAVGVGLAFGVSSQSSADEVTQTRLLTEGSLAAIEDSRSAATRANVLFVTGGALIASSLVIYAIDAL